MATGFVDPNGDGSPLDSGSYTDVAKGARQPTAPSLTPFVGPDKGITLTYLMGTLTGVTEVTAVTVWFYCSSASGNDIIPRVFLAGSWVNGDPQSTGVAGWLSFAFSGSWTQTDLDNLQVQIIFDDQGPGTNITLFAVYAEIIYSGGGGGFQAAWASNSNAIIQ